MTVIDIDIDNVDRILLCMHCVAEKSVWNVGIIV